MNATLRDSRGYTLAEMMITVAIVGIISLVLGSLLINVTRFNRQTTARGNIQANARTAMEVITRRLSEAKGHTITIDRVNTSQPNYSRVYFTDVDGRVVTIYQQGTALYQSVLSGGTTNQTRLANDLYQMMFSYPMSDDTALVSVSLTFQEASYQGASKSLQLSLAKVRIQNPDAE